MSAETQAGWASVLMLLYGLLWWGGALGCVALVATSARSARRQRLGEPEGSSTPTRHDTRVLALRRELAHASSSGRLPNTSTWPAPEHPEPESHPDPQHRTGDLLVLAAGCSAAAAGVHLAMAPLHAADGLTHVAFFVVVGLVQAVQAARLLLGPTRTVLHSVLLLNLGVVSVWAASRTVGVLGTTEPVGSWDLAATAWEIGCVVASLRLARRTTQGLPRPALDPAAWSPLVLGALGLTLLTMSLLPLGGH